MINVCIAGATGFIGQNLIKKLKERNEIEIIALSRKIIPEMDNAKKENVIWRRCNGFSLIDVENATKNVDILVYLIHSMLPSSSLTQGRFEDFDLLLADNFARAAQKNGIKKIVYLSGIIPLDEHLSSHLKSRLEVENALRGYENNVISLRSSLIVGPHGSSFTILEKLIRRLPLLICPAWTLKRTQPIDLNDVLFSIIYCIDHESVSNKIYDIGGPDILSYRDMLDQTAKALGKKRYYINVPFFSPALSKLWVSRITNTSSNLVYPLIESLKHEIIVNKNQQLIIEGHHYSTFEESLIQGLGHKKNVRVREVINYISRLSFTTMETVTSVQRLSKPKIIDCHQLANEYFKWLHKKFSPFIALDSKDDYIDLKFFNKISLICLKKCAERSHENRSLFYVVGGILASKKTYNGRLEFRWVKQSQIVLISLMDFRPALPWFIYKYTQALFHVYVMRQFILKVQF